MMQTWKTLGLLFFVTCGAVTCGSSSGGGGSGGPSASTGSIGGATVATTHAFAIYNSDASDANTNQGLPILMSSSSSFCTLLQAKHFPKDTQYAELGFTVVDISNGSASAPTANGTYSVPDDAAILANGTDKPFNGVDYRFAKSTNDPNCTANVQPVKATSGSATLTSVGSRTSNTVGTYQFTLDSNDTVSGSFDAAPCIIDKAILESNDEPTCQ